VPLFALNQVAPERCEWLVPGMLKDKILALVKSLHQRPRSRLVPLPDYAQACAERLLADPGLASSSLVDALLKDVRQTTQLDIKRADFKPEQLPAHLFMNFRILDEHGRQLGAGRNLPQLKAELGGLARSAFQALAVLLPHTTPSAPSPGTQGQCPSVNGVAPSTAVIATSSPVSLANDPRYTDWTFGELPELMEVHRGAQTLVGFPALIDGQTHVTIEVFDEPQLAQTQHRLGLRRLVALQLRDVLKYLEKNIPDLQKMAGHYLALGSPDVLKDQIIALSLERAFLQDPLPTQVSDFKERMAAGRTRLTLICQEIARSVQAILTEYALAARKLKDSRAPKEVVDDAQSHLARVLPKHFITGTPWPQLAHLPRYLKAITLRLEKYRSDPARDHSKMQEIRPLEQRYQRLLAERKGTPDARLEEFGWLLQELRVSLFAQELKTPQPVSAKRLEKALLQLTG
jgi:ATP-dependent helicase HrpA